MVAGPGGAPGIIEVVGRIVVNQCAVAVAHPFLGFDLSGVGQDVAVVEIEDAG